MKDMIWLSTDKKSSRTVCFPLFLSCLIYPAFTKSMCHQLPNPPMTLSHLGKATPSPSCPAGSAFGTIGPRRENDADTRSPTRCFENMFLHVNPRVRIESLYGMPFLVDLCK